MLTAQPAPAAALPPGPGQEPDAGALLRDDEPGMIPGAAMWWQRAWTVPGRLHPAVASAALGVGDFDTLHYAVKDASRDVLDQVWEYAAPRTATWEVLTPALAGAPAATGTQLARWLTALLLEPAPPDLVQVTDTALELADRLAGTHPDLLLDVLHTVLTQRTDGPVVDVCQALSDTLPDATPGPLSPEPWWV